MSEFTERLVTPPGERVAPQQVVSEDFVEGGSTVKSSSPVSIHDFTDSVSGRRLPESTQKLLDALGDGPVNEEPAETVEDVDPDSPEAAEAALAAKEAAPTEPESKTDDGQETAAPADAKVDTKEPELPSAVAEKITRFEAANAKLLEELDVERKRPHAPQRTKRDELLEEADRGYFDDSIGAVRKLIAASLGLEDPSAKEVDAELSGLYLDLTAKELGVPLEPAHQATREANKARQLLARDKRDRKLEQERAAAPAPASGPPNEIIGFIDQRFAPKAADYPLLTELSELYDGEKPAPLLWKVIQREIQVGRLDAKSTDDELLIAAANLVENHYQALANRTAQALTKKTKPAEKAAKPSTEKSSSADTGESNGASKSHGARTLKNADASVAPATAPTKKVTTQEAKPKFRTDKERREWALRHLK